MSFSMLFEMNQYAMRWKLCDNCLLASRYAATVVPFSLVLCLCLIWIFRGKIWLPLINKTHPTYQDPILAVKA